MCFDLFCTPLNASFSPSYLNKCSSFLLHANYVTLEQQAINLNCYFKIQSKDIKKWSTVKKRLDICQDVT